MMSIDQIIEVLAAYKDKKPLRVRSGSGWEPYSIPFNHYFRDMLHDIAGGAVIEVAPEPIRAWAVVWKDNNGTYQVLYRSKYEAEKAREASLSFDPNARVVEMEEVRDESR